MPRLKAPQRRQQLIDVATKLFAEFGYDATTTASIAERTGVTEPILYRHFETKQDLFIAITREMSHRTLRHWEELIHGIHRPADQIRKIAHEFPHHVRHLADAYHVLHNALATSRDRRVLQVMREHYREIERFFTRVVVNGQKSGEFRPLNPKVPAWMLINLGIGYAMIALNLAQFDHFDVGEGVEFVLRGLKA